MASSARNVYRCFTSQASGSEEFRANLIWQQDPGAKNMEAMINAGKSSRERRRRLPEKPSTQVSQPIPAQDNHKPKYYDGLRSCPPLAWPTNAHRFVALEAGAKLALISDEETTTEVEEPLPTIHIARRVIYTGSPTVIHIRGPIPRPTPQLTAKYPQNTPHPKLLRRPVQLKGIPMSSSSLAPCDTRVRPIHDFKSISQPSQKGPHYFSRQGKVLLAQLKALLCLPDSMPASTLLLNLLTKWKKIRVSLPTRSPWLAKQINDLQWWGVQFEVTNPEERRVLEAWLNRGNKF
ncbi:hypothetical protein QBC43DRAFT_284678 [Cladorrhinum sp. PSN259]|nr:hypothetical protein QBC43DRAFT_284678 [Cladorrhinum sp. PSN259]